MPSDFKALRRGSAWAPLIAGPEEAAPAWQRPVRADPPFAALARGWAAFSPRILDVPAQPDPGWREGLIVYGSPPPVPQGRATFAPRILDQAAQPDPGWRAGLIVYGSPPPPPAGSATFGRRILDQIVQPDPGWREGLIVYGSPAPPPAGWVRFGQRIVDEIPRAGWAMTPIVVGGFAASAPAIAYGSPPPAPEGSIWLAPIPRDPTAEPPPDPGIPPTIAGRDMDIFDAIQAILAGTGEFARDGVDYGSAVEVLDRSAGQYPCVAIEPTGFVEINRWDGVCTLRTVNYDLSIVVRIEEPRERYRQLEYLATVAQNALSGQKLAGIAYGPFTAVARGTISKSSHPEQKIVLYGTFAYVIPDYSARVATRP